MISEVAAASVAQGNNNSQLDEAGKIPPSPTTVNADKILETFGINVTSLQELFNRDMETIVKTNRGHIQGLPAREYLEHTVVPILIEGLKYLLKERPPNPVEYLGLFLLKNAQVIPTSSSAQKPTVDESTSDPQSKKE